MVPSLDELRDVGPTIAMLRVQLNQQLFFVLGPLVSLDSAFEVVVVALPTLLAVPAGDVVVGFHKSGDLAPFFDSVDFVKFLENIILLG